MNMRKTINKEGIKSIALFLLGVVWLYFSLQLKYWDGVTPGPGFFPIWLSVILIIGSLVLFIMMRGWRIIIQQQGSSEESTDKQKRKSGNRKVFISLGMLFIVALTIEYVGFLIISIVMALLLLYTYGSRITWRFGLVVIIACLLFYGLFVLLLIVPLPKCILGIK